MSLGSGFLENIPHFTFTPSEHQVGREGGGGRISAKGTVDLILINSSFGESHARFTLYLINNVADIVVISFKCCYF